jgi:hypothetical protein
MILVNLHNKLNPNKKIEIKGLECPNCGTLLTGMGQVRTDWHIPGGVTKCIHCTK